MTGEKQAVCTEENQLCLPTTLGTQPVPQHSLPSTTPFQNVPKWPVGLTAPMTGAHTLCSRGWAKEDSCNQRVLMSTAGGEQSNAVP